MFFILRAWALVGIVVQGYEILIIMTRYTLSFKPKYFFYLLTPFNPVILN